MCLGPSSLSTFPGVGVQVFEGYGVQVFEGYGVQGFELRIQDFGFRVSGFGCSV